jgi:hypothetical protein
MTVRLRGFHPEKQVFGRAACTSQFVTHEACPSPAPVVGSHSFFLYNRSHVSQHAKPIKLFGNMALYALNVSRDSTRRKVTDGSGRGLGCLLSSEMVRFEKKSTFTVRQVTVYHQVTL